MFDIEIETGVATVMVMLSLIGLAALIAGAIEVIDARKAE